MGHRRFLIINGFETLATGIFVETVSDDGGGR